jgi:hypothetical protein
MALKATHLRPVMTRIPEGLRKRLERAAKANRRSMNAEIIHRLVGSFDPMVPLLLGQLEELAGIIFTPEVIKELERLHRPGEPFGLPAAEVLRRRLAGQPLSDIGAARNVSRAFALGEGGKS